MPDDPEAKEALLAEVDAAIRDATEAEKRGQAITRNARQARELLQPYRDYTAVLPEEAVPREEWLRQTCSVRLLRDAFGQVLQGPDPELAISGAISAVSTTTSGTMYTSFTGTWPPGAFEIASSAAARYEEVQARNDRFDELEEEMRRLGLTRQTREFRSPVETLREAREVYFAPASQAALPIATLIPMRSTVHAAIAELYRRKPRQAPGRSSAEKVRAVLVQCRRAEVGEAIADVLAAETKTVIDDLSEAKDARLSRAEVNHRLRRATQFLHSLLSSIDECTMKPA